MTVLRENEIAGRADTSKKIFSLLIVLYPILNRYASFIPMITLSETFLLFFLIFVILKKKIRIQKIFLPFVVYLSFIFIFHLLSDSNGEESRDNLGTMFRLIFLYVSLTILGRGFLDGKTALKWLNIVACLMVCYCILQWLAAKVGVYLTTYIPGLPIMAEDRDQYILDQQMKYGLTYRPYGLLNEPAALSVYLLLPLAINLFSELHIHSRIKKAAVISLGCFICMSSTGIIMCSLAWFIFVFFNRSAAAKQYRKYALFLILAAIFIIPNTEIWNTFVDRTLGGSISNFNVENTTRFNALDVLSLLFSNPSDLLIGVGMSETVFYLPGFLRVLYTLGVIGLLIIILQFICLYRRGNALQKKLTFFYAGLNIGTEILLGNFAIYYLFFILADKNEIK